MAGWLALGSVGILAGGYRRGLDFGTLKELTVGVWNALLVHVYVPVLSTTSGNKHGRFQRPLK